jgi:hypothetical protein
MSARRVGTIVLDRSNVATIVIVVTITYGNGDEDWRYREYLAEHQEYRCFLG